jgi:hypothetical protein
MWLEDQKQFDDAIGKYHQVAKQTSPRHSGRRANGEGLITIGPAGIARPVKVAGAR